MPTYDYECAACGHAFELFQSMTAPVKRKCPECGAPKLQRLIGRGAAVLFKGSGFYETDYKRPAADAKRDSDSGGAKPGDDQGGGDKPAPSDGGKSSDEGKASDKKPAPDRDGKKRGKQGKPKPDTDKPAGSKLAS